MTSRPPIAVTVQVSGDNYCEESFSRGGNRSPPENVLKPLPLAGFLLPHVSADMQKDALGHWWAGPARVPAHLDKPIAKGK